jgi:hypothetical protein
MRDARRQSRPRWAPGVAAAALATLAVPAAARGRALYVPVRFERDTAGAVIDLNWAGQFVCKKIQ